MSVAEVEDFLSRVNRNEFEIDNEHPDVKSYQGALQAYINNMPEPHIVELLSDEISIAISKGVIKPQREVIARLANEIKDGKVTEQDIDRAQGDSTAKKILKGLLKRLVDRSLKETEDTLSSFVKTQGLCIALLIMNL
jgi:hypothetical protein